MDSQGRKVVVCDNGTGVSAQRGGRGGRWPGRGCAGMCGGRAGPRRPGLHPLASDRRDEGARGSASRLPGRGQPAGRGRPRSLGACPSAAFRVRAAGEAGGGWASHLRPAGPAPRSRGAIRLKGCRGNRLGVCLRRRAPFPGVSGV